MTGKRLALLAAVVLSLVAVPLHAGFDEIANALCKRTGLKRVSVPFLGLARLAVWVVEPNGVRDFQLVTYEATGDVDLAELRDAIRSHIDRGFQPLVQVQSARKGEFSMIYARPRGDDHVELIVFTHDGGDTVLVRVEVDAERLGRSMSRPRNMAVTIASR